jgi:hypothetical protein
MAPDRIRIALLEKLTAGGCDSGTIARSSTAPARASGRRSKVAAAMLAPFEKPTAIGAAIP